MEIKTNIGTFGNFRDLETCMRLEEHEKVNILSIKALLTSWEKLAGEYTYNEIKRVNEMKGELD